MRETVEKSDKRPHCFELYGTGNDIIKACKVDKEGKVVEGKEIFKILTQTDPVKRLGV